MARLNTFILFTCLLSSYLFFCNYGCLKCSASGSCQVCDYSNRYFLSSGVCIETYSKNCELHSIDGRCMKCNAAYYLDYSTLKCVAIPTENVVLNCQYYNYNLSCLYCMDGFYLNNSICEAVPNAIDNCLYYQSNNPTRCLLCKTGFIITLDNGLCLPITEADHCSMYSLVKCNKCKGNYVVDKNMYSYALVPPSFTSSSLYLYSYMLMLDRSEKYGYTFDQCNKVTVANCEELENYFKCKKCDAGYYLNATSTCTAYPYEGVPNCEIYTALNRCTSCGQGYYLLNQTTCTENAVITNCKTYSTTSYTSICTECTKEFYLIDSKCAKREVSPLIEHCYSYSNTWDLCSECLTGYSLTSDGLACKKEIARCMTYNESRAADAKLTCAICDLGYFIDPLTGMCIKGQKSYCAKYSVNSEVCATCNNRFYLNSNNTCVEHRSISNCDQYSNWTKNSCDVCEDRYMKFKQKNTCVPIKAIVNCESQTSSDVCLRCASGFLMDNAGDCTRDTGNAKCKKLNSNNKCTECDTDYILWTRTNKCVSPLPYQSTYCSNLVVDTSTNTYSCEYCTSDALPVYFNSYNVCIAKTDDLTPNYPVNCSTIELVGAQHVCCECNDGFFLDETDNSCQNTCTNTIVLVTLNFSTNSVIKNKYNVCKDIGNASCKYAVQRADVGSDSLICIECKDGSYPHYLSTNVGPQGYTAFAKSSGNWVSNFTAETVAVVCGNPGSFSFQPGTSSFSVSNCELYMLTGTSFGCIRCATGYTGSAANGYIENCGYTISDCDTDVSYTGLYHPEGTGYSSSKTMVSTFASCFACLDNKLPTLFINRVSNSALSIKPFDLDNNTPLTNLPTDLMMMCLEANSTDLGLNPGSIMDTLPAECGFIVYYVNRAKSADINNNPSILCGGCSPGYSPVYTNNMISNCIPIPDCSINISTQYNKCGMCSNGTVYGWDQDSQSPDLSSCIDTANNNNNCTAGTSNECRACSENYVLNADNLCDIYSLPKCTVFNISTTPFSSANPDLGYALFKAMKGDGCTSCNSSFTKYRTTESICLYSVYKATHKIPPTTNLISHCDYFYMSSSGGLYCYKCTTSYIPHVSIQSCVKVSIRLKDCLYAVTSDICDECKPSFVLVSNRCRSPSIGYCSEYYQGETSQKCKICEDGYYLTSSYTCMEGNIQFCARYNSETVCTYCDEGYITVSVGDGSNYCYPSPQGFNCTTFNLNFNNMVIDCRTCDAGYEKTSNDGSIAENRCLAHALIPNCIKYDVRDNFYESTMDCTLCSPEYYLVNNVCEPRVYKDVNCEYLVIDKDLCRECQTGTFLAPDERSCSSFPTGIQGCEVYSNATTCESCKPGFYLLQNACSRVPIENLSSNCIYYSDPVYCSLCIERYVVVQGKCELIKAENCVKAVDPLTCATCPESFGFRNYDGKLNCFSISDPYCTDHTDNYPFICLQCARNYYKNLLTGFCSKVENPITNCMINTTEFDCSKCAEGYVLSDNNRFCLEISTVNIKIDSNCIDVEITSGGNCIACKPGYYFNSQGYCIACDKMTLESRCFMCDPYYQSKCLMCKPGYYQNAFGNCLKMPSNVRQIDNGSWASLLSVWGVLAVLLRLI